MSLTPRQWKLYELLKDNTQRWITQLEIQKTMSSDYPDYDGQKNFHDSNARYDIGEDICKINESDVIQKIILSSSSGIKIATADEYRVWSQNKWKSLKQQISRLAWKDHKSRLDGQMKLVFGESMERDYYEAFVKNYKDFLEDK
jgi:hypothetical protein